MPSRSISVFLSGKILFFNDRVIHKHTHTPFLLIHSSIDEHLGCLYILAIINNVAMDIEVHVPLQISVFISL